MKAKIFEKNPLTGRLIPLIMLALIGYGAGVWLILLEGLFTVGVAVIIGTTIGDIILIADAVSNLACPDCGERLHRDRKAPKPTVRYICPVCEVTWEMPPK